MSYSVVGSSNVKEEGLEGDREHILALVNMSF